MAISFALATGGVMVMGYRSMPFWPDLKVAWHRTVTRRTRDNLSGLSVIFVGSEGDHASDRALLDFNVLFRTFPDGLPQSPMVSLLKHAAALACPAHLLKPDVDLLARRFMFTQQSLKSREAVLLMQAW